MKTTIAIAVLFLCACAPSRRVKVDRYHHEELRRTVMEFTFGRGPTAKRDTEEVIYWDYLLVWRDAVTHKDTTVVCEGFTRFRTLSDERIHQLAR